MQVFIHWQQESTTPHIDLQGVAARCGDPSSLESIQIAVERSARCALICRAGSLEQIMTQGISIAFPIDVMHWRTLGRTQPGVDRASQQWHRDLIL